MPAVQLIVGTGNPDKIQPELFRAPLKYKEARKRIRKQNSLGKRTIEADRTENALFRKHFKLIGIPEEHIKRHSLRHCLLLSGNFDPAVSGSKP